MKKNVKKYSISISIIILIIVTITLLWNMVFKSQEYFPAVNNNNPETVIVLHGIRRTNRHSYLLAKRLSEAGFEVYNITYPFADHSIEDIVDFLHKKFDELGIDKKKKINFVGHSMGGLVIRGYINKYKPKNLHRVAMIATPNHGSELADKFKNWHLYRWIFGDKSSMQLTTDLGSLENFYGNVDYDLGIIAGKSWHKPFFSSILPGDDDGLVSVESTKLSGMKEHVVLNFSHALGLHYREVSDYVIRYLKTGSFEPNN